MPPIDRNINNMAAAAAAHCRQHGLHHRNGAEYIDFELAANIFQRRFLQYAFVTIAGVIDQDIDRADFRSRSLRPSALWRRCR